MGERRAGSQPRLAAQQRRLVNDRSSCEPAQRKRAGTPEKRRGKPAPPSQRSTGRRLASWTARMANAGRYRGVVLLRTREDLAWMQEAQVESAQALDALDDERPVKAQLVSRHPCARCGRGAGAVLVAARAVRACRARRARRKAVKWVVVEQQIIAREGKREGQSACSAVARPEQAVTPTGSLRHCLSFMRPSRQRTCDERRVEPSMSELRTKE